MKKFVLLMAGIFATECMYAQFNDSTFYMVRYGVTGIVNRTNEASSYNISNGLRFSVSKKKVVLNSNTSWVYGQQQKKLTNNDFYSALDVNWYPKMRKFYYWGLTTYEASFSLKVNNRTQVGAGAAYNLVDKKDTFFINLSDGILYGLQILKSMKQAMMFTVLSVTPSGSGSVISLMSGWRLKAFLFFKIH